MQFYLFNPFLTKKYDLTVFTAPNLPEPETAYADTPAIYRRSFAITT